MLIVISDGSDNVSAHGLNDALEMAIRSGVTIYTVSVLDKEYLGQRHPMLQLSESTAGRSYFTNRADELDKVFEKISQDLHSYYVATFARSGRADIDSFHNLRVTSLRPDVKVFGRTGYIGR